MSIHGLFNDYLGRNGSVSSFKSCKSSSDCTGVPYCPSSSLGDMNKAICSGTQVCVCSRAHYHPAVDPALIPSLNTAPGYFVVSDFDDGKSPMFTEPFWSSTIGVVIFRDGNPAVEYWILGAGLIVGALSIIVAFSLRRRMQKEKLY